MERFNRTLSKIIHKILPNFCFYHYLNVLDQLLQTYDETYHLSIKRAPIEVSPENERDVWLALYENMENVKRTSCNFNIGDTVHVSKQKLTF